MSVITERIPVTELLAGLAEEASELAQAALKLRRCYDGTNPTPADPDLQYEALLEEIGDVELYLDQMSINRLVINDYKAAKLERWKNRLEGVKE
jgi:NTP pyrophosphatase (non-canonical NTP hydrolase)